MECRTLRLPALTQGLPTSQETSRGSTTSPCLCPEPLGEWHAKSPVTTQRGALCNSAAGPADHPVGQVPLCASRGPYRQSLPAPGSAPQPRGHSGRPGRAPLTWAGHLAPRASLEAERPTGRGVAFIPTPSSLSEAAPPPLPPWCDSPSLERSPGPALPYVTALPPPQTHRASIHPPHPLTPRVWAQSSV